ncbi:hypothetical protein K32_43370 [Kaistia sp. 32K]|uniref:DUF1993 domain-containing protein n=1 Tax=Kaistia sp. 32K TaxID=2795690 RepID=UPI001914E67E|nr:DUF1993 domain-containing protein [Kaistia sp. 32K]BCP55720.1 hypothetical protein K32_43370 [Kaistia sp. 32K]
MALSIYEASLPVFIRSFGNLQAILDKAVEQSVRDGIDPATLIEARLAPDMLPLSGQVQRASDTAKGAAARLAGIDNPSFADTETTFPELKARIGKTVAFLNSVRPEQLEGSETRTISMRNGAVQLDGRTYLFTHALPNFFFHVSTAYGVLRHKGITIGKADFLGNR